MGKNFITPKELDLPTSIPMPYRNDWRIGIIGFGGIARGAHIPSFKEAGWSVVAVADTDPHARKLAKDDFGIQKVYSDYNDLIADESVEVIDLCTHPILREEVVISAAKQKKHIITEKPFGMTVNECVRMIDIANRSAIKLAVHQNYRWMRMNFLVHHILKKGLIGEPFFASIEIFGRQDVELANHDFYSKCDNFLTVQWDNHLADLLRYWTGKDAIRVFAKTGRMNEQNFVSDNLLMVVADFGQGLTGHILHSELLRSHLGGVQCRIDGNKGSLKFNFHNELCIDFGKGPLMLDTKELNFVSSHCGSMADFLIAIEEDKEPSVSGRRNLQTIITILAEDESAKAGGKWVYCSI